MESGVVDEYTDSDRICETSPGKSVGEDLAEICMSVPHMQEHCIMVSRFNFAPYSRPQQQNLLSKFWPCSVVPVRSFLLLMK
jgi:hypothetical protein